MVKKRAESVVKVYPPDMEWIRDEQYRIRKETGKEPSQPEIVAWLVERWRASSISDDAGKSAEKVKRGALQSIATDQVAPHYPEEFAMLAEILDSGDEDTATAVRANLREFVRLLRAVAKVEEAERRLRELERRAAGDSGAVGRSSDAPQPERRAPRKRTG